MSGANSYATECVIRYRRYTQSTKCDWNTSFYMYNRFWFYLWSLCHILEQKMIQNTYVCECCDDCLRTAELATAINTSKVPKELPTKLCTDLNKKKKSSVDMGNDAFLKGFSCSIYVPACQQYIKWYFSFTNPQWPCFSYCILIRTILFFVFLQIQWHIAGSRLCNFFYTT